MAVSHWRNRSLLKALIKREIIGRYRGSFFGILWSFFNPLFMLAIYTFVFSEILKARWGANGNSKAEFALILFAGLMPFNLFAEIISRSPNLIISNVNYVKKVVFPLEILPSVAIGSALFHLFISLSVWLLAYMLFYGTPQATVLSFPFLIAPFCLFSLGLGWILASLGVFIRDVSQFVGLIVTALMFLSPIFYPASSLPETYRALMYLNPLTPMIEYSRDVLFWGKQPDFVDFCIYTLVSVTIAWIGFVWFQKTRKGFADVL
ncbi:ABC-type polysaccharide/polyol phosphate export system protein, permease component [Rhizobium sp. CF122]|nr:ABC-type polysaccharide/polyol phosphate export system protein, permease component [Rhizobium sp. CF122]